MTAEPTRLSLKQSDGDGIVPSTESASFFKASPGRSSLSNVTNAETGNSPLPLRLKNRPSRLSLKQNDGIVIVPSTEPASFSLIITGQIVYAQTSPSLLVNDRLYCRYSFSYGQDWTISHGMTEGITQIACSRRAKDEDGKGRVNVCVFNFPIEISFQSTNPYGWPRLCFSVYGIDFLGRDVLRGYGSVLLPTNPGRHTKVINTFRPVSGNALQQFVSMVTATQPEYHDTKITAKDQGRALTRVVGENNLTVKINFVTTRTDFQSFGYVSMM